MDIGCSHCGVILEVEGDPSGTVPCPSCGAPLSLDGLGPELEEATEEKPASPPKKRRPKKSLHSTRTQMGRKKAKKPGTRTNISLKRKK